MGDSYVKSEFRLTRKTDNPLHIIAFLGQWKLYLDEVQGSVASESQATSREARWTGRKLDMDALNKLSKEQVGQLYELMHATKDVWKRSASHLQLSAELTGSTDELEDQASTAEAADGIKGKA